jgi:hypothetical protein
MTTRQTIEGYLSSLQRKDGWEDYFADDMVFTSYVSPVKQVSGRSAFLQATKGFVAELFAVSESRIRSLEIYFDSAAFPRQ